MSFIQHPLKDLYPPSLLAPQAFTAKDSIRNEDIMSLVAKYLSDKDLVSYSAVDVATRQIGLQQRSIRAVKTFKRELQEFIELAVPDTSACIPGTNLIDFYRNFLIILKSHIEIGNSAEECDAFGQKHQQRLINFVAQDSLTLSRKLQAAIWEKTLSFKQIQDECESVKYSIILEAVNTTINSAPNPLALRGLTVSAAAKSHQFDLIQSLLARGDISDEHRGIAAMVGALHNPSLDFFQILLSRGSISDQHRADAIVLAAAAGHKLIIEFLLTTGNISVQYKQLAIAFAQANHHIEIVQILQPVDT